MRTFDLERTQLVEVPIDEAWTFYCDPWNLEQITPPWLRFRIDDAPARLRAGSRLRYRLHLVGVPIRWLTEIRLWQPPRSFVDVQLQGPYRLWEHTHRLSEREGGTEIHDHVRYRPPTGVAADVLVRPLLDQIFDYRACRTAELLSSTS